VLRARSEGGFIGERLQECLPRDELCSANNDVPGLGFGQPPQRRYLRERDAADEKDDCHLGLVCSSACAGGGSSGNGLKFFEQGPGDGAQQLVRSAGVEVAAQQLRQGRRYARARGTSTVKESHGGVAEPGV
jgi:hypothetical protein